MAKRTKNWQDAERPESLRRRMETRLPPQRSQNNMYEIKIVTQFAAATGWKTSMEMRGLHATTGSGGVPVGNLDATGC